MLTKKLNEALTHILQAHEILSEAVDTNQSFERIYGAHLRRIVSGLMTYGDNRDNLITTQIGLDTMIEEQGLTWRNDQPEDASEIPAWLDKIEELMPEPYQRRYFTTAKDAQRKNFFYQPMLSTEEERNFRIKTKTIM